MFTAAISASKSPIGRVAQVVQFQMPAPEASIESSTFEFVLYGAGKIRIKRMGVSAQEYAKAF
jgi:hypothetical protein